ncbi:MAG TPA: zf-HC2 domain-containing protein [Gemmatimonadaceae bacterium]|jgi:anti-sigma factor (TIGR02949 family)|nr:zf-HC2 domain-containing protein [Gemmatimonadaceae bacterium]
MTPMLDCDAVMRQLWDYLDGELDEARMTAVREHLVLCGRCYPQFEFEKTFLDTLARARREHSDVAAVRARVLEALGAEGYVAA